MLNSLYALVLTDSLHLPTRKAFFFYPFKIKSRKEIYHD